MTSPDNSRSLEFAITAVASAALYLLYSYRKQASWTLEAAPTTKYQGGEDYAESKAVVTGLAQDLKAAGVKTSRKNLRTLLKVALSKGEPLDEKQLPVSLVKRTVILLLNLLLIDGASHCSAYFVTFNLQNQEDSDQQVD